MAGMKRTLAVLCAGIVLSVAAILMIALASSATLGQEAESPPKDSATESKQRTIPREIAEHRLLQTGPLVGQVTETTALLWLQTGTPCTVQLRYYPRDARGEARMSSRVITSKAGDHIARFELTELKHGTAYAAEVYLNDRWVFPDRPILFKTQVNWQYIKQPPDISICFGSCVWMDDPSVDREGSSRQGDLGIFDAIAKTDPDLMLWLGDNVYFRQTDFSSESGMRHRYRFDRSKLRMHPLFREISNIATWDDHDYGPNNSDGSYSLKGEALKVFKDYWPAQRYGLRETQACFQKISIADVDLFLLDGRSFRSSGRSKAADRTLLGMAQLEWLKDGLLSSNAYFKIIACGSQMLNPITLYEGWGDYQPEREAFLSWLVENQVMGVLFLTGDRHFSELIRIEPEGLYPLYDFTSSPLTSSAYSGHEDEQDNPARVDGTIVKETRSFGRITLSGERRERNLTMSAHDGTGKELWKHEIPILELWPGH